MIVLPVIITASPDRLWLATSAMVLPLILRI
jgi:hypothetical protein